MLETKELAVRIQDANHKFAEFFARWPAPRRDQAGISALLQQLPIVFGALEAVGGALSPGTLEAGGASAAVQATIDAYSANLKRFRQFLTELEPVLAERRDQLAADGARLRDVKAWSKALKLIG